MGVIWINKTLEIPEIDPRLLALAAGFRPKLMVNFGDFTGARRVNNQCGAGYGIVNGSARITDKGLVVDGSANCNVTFPSTFGVSDNSTSILLVGATFSGASQSGALVKVGEGGGGANDGIAIGIGASTMDADDTYCVGLLEGSAWVPTSTRIGADYHTLGYLHYQSAGSRAAIFVDGTTALAGSATSTLISTTGNTYIGGYYTRMFVGTIHWVAILEGPGGSTSVFDSSKQRVSSLYPFAGGKWQQRIGKKRPFFFTTTSTSTTPKVIWTSRTRTKQPQGPAQIRGDLRSEAVSAWVATNTTGWDVVKNAPNPTTATTGLSFGVGAIGRFMRYAGGAGTYAGLTTKFPSATKITVVIAGVLSYPGRLFESPLFALLMGSNTTFDMYVSGALRFSVSWGAQSRKALVLSYDFSNTSNTPVVYVDGAAATITPTGTPTVGSNAGTMTLFNHPAALDRQIAADIAGAVVLAGVYPNWMLRSWSNDPWQLFAPERTPAFFSLASSGTSTIKPLIPFRRIWTRQPR